LTYLFKDGCHLTVHITLRAGGAHVTHSARKEFQSKKNVLGACKASQHQSDRQNPYITGSITYREKLMRHVSPPRGGTRRPPAAWRSSVQGSATSTVHDLVPDASLMRPSTETACRIGDHPSGEIGDERCKSRCARVRTPRPCVQAGKALFVCHKRQHPKRPRTIQFGPPRSRSRPLATPTNTPVGPSLCVCTAGGMVSKLMIGVPPFLYGRVNH
jgi:hypothetical protein